MSETVSVHPFTGFPYFLTTAFAYLNIGILFGGLNALRKAGIINAIGIHQTHWTSTLIGGMTVLMMSEIYYILSRHLKRPNWADSGMYVMLGLIILGTISNYIQAWFPENVLGHYFPELIKSASLVYLVIVLTLVKDNWGKLVPEPSFIMLYAAIFWMGISQLIFLGYRGLIGPTFKVPYIYGFFSLTLFGSLSYILPKIFKSVPRSQGTITRDTLLISLSATSLLLNEFIDLSSLLGLIGSVLWGLVGFLFILYVFDLIFKNGFKPALLGLSLALIMFGFFVFDTFMKSVFPVWVTASHAHFMFLGTLLITVVSIATSVEENRSSTPPSGLFKVGIGLVMFFVSLILTGFIIVAFSGNGFGYEFAGISGFGLFTSIVFLESVYLLKK